MKKSLSAGTSGASPAAPAMAAPPSSGAEPRRAPLLVLGAPPLTLGSARACTEREFFVDNLLVQIHAPLLLGVPPLTLGSARACHLAHKKQHPPRGPP